MDKYQLFHSLIKGDIKKIATTSGYCREYTGKVLNPAYNFNNQTITTTAIQVVTERQTKVA